MKAAEKQPNEKTSLEFHAPSLSAIRAKIDKNISENRALRSLYRAIRKAELERQEGAQHA